MKENVLDFSNESAKINENYKAKLECFTNISTQLHAIGMFVAAVFVG